jgi:hypothetical protein
MLGPAGRDVSPFAPPPGSESGRAQAGSQCVRALVVTVALLATDAEALAVGDALRRQLAGWPDRAPSDSQR